MESSELTRGAGVLLSISSLPSSYGIGTLGDAAFRFVDFLVDLKQNYWQVLPIGPTSYGNSPYQSLSAFAGNPYLIDLDILVRQGLLTGEQIRSFCWGENETKIDYAILYQNRYQILKMAFEQFDTGKQDYREFIEENADWIEDYALFMALKAYFKDQEWLVWDEGIRNRRSEALYIYQKKLCQEINFYKFCQYEFFQQWNALKLYANARGIQIIGDIPLYVAHDSCDVWAHRELFQLREDGKPIGVSGIPRDNFSANGQIWGSPVYDWDQMVAEKFLWWKKRMQLSSKLYDVARQDHFIGIVRYYMVKNEAVSAENGKWHRGPGKKFTDAVISAGGNLKIIVDDIGPQNVIPGVKKIVAKTGWPRIRILMFAFDDDTANEHLPHNYESRNLIVYPGMHDNETIVGHFYSKTDYELAYLYEYLNIKTKEEIPDALIRAAYSSVADVVIIQMQDLLKLGNEARMNAPATLDQNWQWRIGADSLSEERRAWIRTLAAVYRR